MEGIVVSGEDDMLRAIVGVIPRAARVIEGGAGPNGSPVTTRLRSVASFVASYDPFLVDANCSQFATRQGVLAAHEGTRLLHVGERWNRSTVRPSGIDSVPTVETREVRAYDIVKEIWLHRANTLVLDVEGSELELLMAPLPESIRLGIVELHRFAVDPWWGSVEWVLGQQGFHVSETDAGNGLSIVVFNR